MSENGKRDSVQWAKLDSYKKRFIESMEDNLARAWLWMYFSGLSVDEIAKEYSCSKTRVYVSLKTNIEKYNQFFRAEKEKAAVQVAQDKQSPAKQTTQRQTETIVILRLSFADSFIFFISSEVQTMIAVTPRTTAIEANAINVILLPP